MTSKAKSVFLACGNFFFTYRNFMFPVALATLFIASRPRLVGDLRADLALMAAGCLLVVAGQGFRLLVIGYAYIKRGGKDGQIYADTLVVKGFFAHSRNPMYLGNMSIIVGLCVLYGSLWAYAVVLPFFCFGYLAITFAEETYLRGRFGKEYEAYEERVPRFWPAFRGLRKSLQDFEYDWRRAVRKDYGNVFQNFFVMVVIAAWKAHSYFGNAAVYAGVALLSLLVTFYVVARISKKRWEAFARRFERERESRNN